MAISFPFILPNPRVVVRGQGEKVESALWGDKKGPGVTEESYHQDICLDTLIHIARFGTAQEVILD